MSENPEILAPFRRALAFPDRERRLLRLVLEFKRSGGSEDEARKILNALRPDGFGDSPEDEAIKDVLDCVGGWCSPSAYIFGKDFDEAYFSDFMRLDS